LRKKGGEERWKIVVKLGEANQTGKRRRGGRGKLEEKQ